jgi:uncharacterized protein (TIGR03083 family)
MPVTADDLEAALDAVLTTLRPATGGDWSVSAGGLEWDCRRTAEHLGDGLLSYAAQLVVQPPARYVRFRAEAERDASPAEVLELTETGARLLAATVRTSSPLVRAFHPSGMAEPAGFAAMGCVELLAHGHDIAEGLGLTLAPPPDVCAHALQRLFPEVWAAPASDDPWLTLLWATGRAALPGHPRRTEWGWQGTPPATMPG